LPPVTGKVALVDNSIGNIATNDRQQAVVDFRTQVMAQTRLAFAMNPIHPIETLHNAHPTPARLPDRDNLPRPTDYQNGFTGWIGRIVYDINSTRLQPGN
jgi:hypothetical protein